MDYSIPDLIGTLGVVMIIGSYLLVQLGRLNATSAAYTLANALGALFVLVSLYFDFNLSAFLIELFWLLISLVGLLRVTLRKPSGG
jgi:hypothetical protein